MLTLHASVDEAEYEAQDSKWHRDEGPEEGATSVAEKECAYEE